MGTREDLASELANLDVGNGEFPDLVQHAATLYNGITINLHSPADLADALKKIDHRLRPRLQPSAEMDR